MFLSHLLIDTGNDPNKPAWGISRRWLRNLYRVHQRLCMAFPSNDRKKSDPHFLKPYEPKAFQAEPKAFQGQVHVQRKDSLGFLFRIDPQPGGRVVILVQSAARPDWEYAFYNAEYLLAAEPECREFDPCYEKGQRLRFRLMANPTRRLSPRSLGPDGQPIQHGVGKRVPVPNDRLASWLIRRAEKGGFTVDKDSLSLQPGYVYIKKEREKPGRRLRSCRYEGLLTVTDPERFRQTIVQGIGPAKAFGFGLLSVASVARSGK